MAGPLNGSADSLAGGILIPTMVQTSSDLLGYWTSLTCLYDPDWNAEQSRVTLPIAFFHIKSIREICTTNVSKKRVMLYEPQAKAKANAAADGLSANAANRYSASDLSNQFRRSILRSIVDNAYREAKTYEIEAIVPFQPVGRYINDGISVLTNTILSFLSVLGISDLAASQSFMSNISKVTKWISPITSAVEAAGKLPNMDGVSYINKNSLEAMWDSMHFLCMKMWTGYDYKYVMITNIIFTKSPTEDDVYRASVQVMEVPVLTVTKPKKLVVNTINRNLAAKAVSYAQEALSKPLELLTGVRDATK